jgi:hypothetical protein
MAEVEWTDLAEDRDMCQAIANIENVGFDKMWRVFWLAKELLATNHKPYAVKHLLL